MKRRGWKYHVRLFLGSVAQEIAWRLCDPHDTWVIDYWGDDGHRYGTDCYGPYSMARIRARELGGRVIGHGGERIEAGPDSDGYHEIPA